MMRIHDAALQDAITSKNDEQIEKVLKALKINKINFARNLRPLIFNEKINAIHVAANTEGLTNNLLVNKLILAVQSAFEKKEAMLLLTPLMQENRLFTNPACSFEYVRRLIRVHFPGFSCKLPKRPFTMYFDMDKARGENKSVGQHGKCQREFKLKPRRNQHRGNNLMPENTVTQHQFMHFDNDEARSYIFKKR